ncbi:membrane-targeted effector domain-containing toxin [Pseudomonas palleroniana]|uniref:membrane-targeted effector domain-containing toxin n=1 Tax=Pseudomonas palleroniana TaxID=191390 RepID=UPI001FCC805C|nr:membrane-targeted effector domain-containing toxin [Pseudomonas palleroniana]UOK39595.1 membrane-targeted effector domain-containing toxin [Pseudomonas palleroniana]
MSTPSASQLEQLHAQLLEIDPSLRSQVSKPAPPPQELTDLEKLNATLKQANHTFLDQARALYQDLAQVDLSQTGGKALLTRLRAKLNEQLQDLDDTSSVTGQGRQTFMRYAAGSTALEREASLNIKDHLLNPVDLRMLEDCSRVPSLRPGIYALTFTYQEQSVEFAGAFVLTRQPSPVVDSLTSDAALGPVLLFTPSAGLYGFDTLLELDQSLKANMAERGEILRHLPVRYQHLGVADIWPLELRPIDDLLVFEHSYQALLDKRRLDIDLALSLVNNPRTDSAQLIEELDAAISAAQPDLSQRLAMRRQRLLEWALHKSLPDWYRNADDAKQANLADCIVQYNQARQTFLELFGPWITPGALAHYQLLEQLADQLEIHDLDPQQLLVTTRREVADVGAYVQQRSLVDVALAGLHSDDRLPGSAFLKHTTLSYAGAPLQGRHAHLTPHSLLDLLQPLDPRLEFAAQQKKAMATPEIRQATKAMLDRRLALLAYTANLQGHLSAADYQLFEQLRSTPGSALRAQTVLLHGAQLKDLWLLRENDANGQPKRLLLCTPDSPRGQMFIAFNSLRECQTHILAWAADTTRHNGKTMADYLLEQVPQRFRPTMRIVAGNLGFRPDAMEHEEVTLGTPCTHNACMDAMVEHLMAQLIDDYEYSSPLWLRSASQTERIRLTSLAEDAEGALRTYNARPDAEANFPTFAAYVHEQATLSLNKLLGRMHNKVDPDLVFAYTPKTLLGQGPKPLSYTELYRDGYADNVGFINEDFSSSATFRGPPGVDLSALTPQKVAAAVRGVWIGKRYTDLVHTQLQAANSPGYTERRNATLKITQLQMQNAALQSRLEGHIASVDLSWLTQAISSLGQSAVTQRTTYKIHRLFIDGSWVMGVYLFSHADNPVLLYTPNAPDGISFREAKLFNYLLKTLDGAVEYFCSRTAQQSQARIRDVLETAKKGLPDDINRTSPSRPHYDSIERVTPLTDLRHEFYNMVLQRRIDDVHATTVNRTQMIMGIVWTCVEWVTAIATIPFPILSLTLGGLLAFKDALLALNAWHQGDRDGALLHYIGYLANLGGALLFDLRPAFRGPFNALRPTLKTGKQAADSALLKQLEPTSPPDMQPLLFDGQPYWVKPTPDALGRHLLYRQDPASGQMRSTARLVNQDTEGRWVRSGVTGGGRKKYELLPEEVDDSLAKYEISPSEGKYFRAVLDEGFKARLVTNWDPDVIGATQRYVYDQLQPLRNAYVGQIEQLTKDAEAFFLRPRVHPIKPQVPPVAAETAHAELLKLLFSPGKQLLIGAHNASIASKQLLIENMQSLAEQGLKRLYIENLPVDVFRSKLKILNREVEGNVAVALERITEHLARVDQALGFAADAPFSFRKLVLEAHKHNVIIDGLDASSSYHMEHVLALGDGERLIPRSSRLRNFYSHQAIARNVKNRPGEGWIALVEQDRMGSHAMTTGLADLQNTLALRVQDVAPDQPVGVWVDTLPATQSRGHLTLSLSTNLHVRAQPAVAQAPAVTAGATHFNEFDMPHAMKKQAGQLAASHRGLDTRYALHQDDPRQATFAEFMRIRERLIERAEAFFAGYTAPRRSALAYLANLTNEEDLIKRLFQQKLGLVIGEAHSAQSSKEFLIKHMKLLKKQGVKTLYVEHLLTDLHQHELDILHDTLKMPSGLQAYLNAQDQGHMLMYTGPNTYTNVIKAANKYGLRVRALDCTASYHTKGARGSSPRNTLFSYFANEVIKADQAAFGPHKWVAFMGSGHTDMNLLVPGIAQLQDAVSLHVRDAAAGTARTLQQGGWVVDETSSLALRSDFTLQVGVAGRRAIRPPAPPSRERLRLKGHFIIERPSAYETNLVHHSNSGDIVVTPIQIDDMGQFFIDRWEGIRDKRFVYQSQLIEALKYEIHLTPAP